MGWGALVFGLLLLAYLGPCLDGDVFVSTEVVHRATPPWSLEGEAPDPHNPFLADHSTIYLPWLTHTRRELRAGRFPLWTGESYAGAPYFGNYSVGLLSPFTWLFVLLPFHAAFALVAALKWAVAALGTWLFLRTLGLRGMAAWLPAVVFAFAGFQVVWINSALTHVSVFAPWCLWSIERARKRFTLRRGVVVALCQGLQLVGGHPETSFYVGIASGLYLLLRGVERRGTKWRATAAVLVSMLAGVGLTAVQWLPFLEYSGLSDARVRLRNAHFDLFEALVSPLSMGGVAWAASAVGALFLARRCGRRVAMFAAVAWTALAARMLGMQASLLLQGIPDLYGNPLDGGAYLGPLTYTDVCGGFVGSGVLLLALVAVARARVGRPAWALASCALLLAARPFRVPYLAQLLDHLPGFAETGGTRALAAFALVVAALAGLGLRIVQRDPRSLLAPAGVAVAFGLGLAVPVEEAFAAYAPGPSSHAVFREPPTQWRPDSESWNAAQPLLFEGRLPAGVDRAELRINGHSVDQVRAGDTVSGPRSFQFAWVGSQRVEEGRYRFVLQTPEGIELDRAVVDVLRPVVPSWRWLLPLGTLVLALVVARRGGRRGLAALGAWSLLELVVFGVRYNDSTAPERMPRTVQPLTLLQEELQRGLDRGEGPWRFLGAGTALQPNLHYLVGLHALRGYDALEPYAYVAVLRYLFEGGEERIWFEQDFQSLDLGGALADVLNLRWMLVVEESGVANEVDAGWFECWRQGRLVLYENSEVMARAYTVGRVHSVEASGLPDPAQFLGGDFLRTHAVRDTGPNQVFEGVHEVRSIEYRSGAIDVEVASDAGCQLVVSENAFPGWIAQIDGEPIEIERVNGFMLSVPVGAGEHRVSFRYQPDSFRRGQAISAGVAVVLLLASLWSGRWPLRRRSRNYFPVPRQQAPKP